MLKFAAQLSFSVRFEEIIMATQAAEEVEISVEKLLHDIKTVINDGEALLRAGAKNLSAQGTAAQERLRAALELAKDTQRRLQSRALQTARAADQLVHDNPYRFLGLAFGVGILFGTLARRR
jgi:ElaB/YqjD/DUF883 family membrane-anchored ribosome-binding protein